MTEAMQMVRDTLGDEAVIVATREERGGNIHVTAAVEPHFEVAQGGMGGVDDWLQYDDEDEENAVAEELTEALLRHNVPEDIMDNIISCATVIGLDDPAQALTAAIDHLFSFNKLPQKPSKKAQMVVGLPGAGKTLIVAKMATRAVMNGLKVGVISCDSVRAGGAEQLAAFTKLLKIDLKRAQDAETLKRHLLDLRAQGCEQILIDAPGINPFEKEDVRRLAKFLSSAPIEAHLALQAGTDTEECSELARIFAAIGVESIIPTRLDIARRLGGVLAAAQHGRLHISDWSETPKVANGLTLSSAQGLAGRLMPRAFRGQSDGMSPKPKTAMQGQH